MDEFKVNLNEMAEALKRNYHPHVFNVIKKIRDYFGLDNYRKLSEDQIHNMIMATRRV